MSRALLWALALSAAWSCGPASKPYRCGVRVSCACDCAICTERDAGLCTRIEPTQNTAQTCLPPEAGSADECASAATLALDAGAHACADACADEVALVTGWDVLGCKIMPRPDSALRLVNADAQVCRPSTLDGGSL